MDRYVGASQGVGLYCGLDCRRAWVQSNAPDYPRDQAPEEARVAALNASLMLAGLYHIGPSGIKGAADAFLHGAGNALGGITHAFHDLEELGKGAAAMDGAVCLRVVRMWAHAQRCARRRLRL